MLAIWSLVPFSFLNRACRFESSQFIYCWNLKDFEPNLASIWNERNCTLVWRFFSIALFGIGLKTGLFQSCGQCWRFQICWHMECSTLTGSSFKILNTSAGILSPPLALFLEMLPKASWLHISGCLDLGEWSHHCGYLGHEDLFYIVLLCICCHLFLISSASVRFLPLLSFIVLILAWNIPLVSLIFLKRSLVFPFLLFSSVSLHWSLRKAFI